MRSQSHDPELDSLLGRFFVAGGVLDYAFVEVLDDRSPHARHRAAALAGMAEIDRRLEQWAVRNAWAKCPVETFYRVRWDEAKLMGEQVNLSTFWGTDDVELTPIGDGAWSIPNRDGYKTAFFLPPYTLRGSPDEKAALFAGINEHVLGACPERAEIFSWSTDWSNYFDAGHEWWGAFYWTIHPVGSRMIAVVGASSTD